MNYQMDLHVYSKIEARFNIADCHIWQEAEC
jgi:hypothetical protein